MTDPVTPREDGVRSYLYALARLRGDPDAVACGAAGIERPLRVLDLFSGIGGFSLGLERAGMRTVAFCEIDPFCRDVLAKHWPGVPRYDDVRTLTAERLAADGIGVDVICGGFPCQDISVAGKGDGIDGARSGLWSEYARLVGELRPRFVIVENVAALLARGLDRVLGDLAALGFDAEWHCIPASAVGAPHRRDRVWIVAYPNGQGRGERGECNGEPVAWVEASQRHDAGGCCQDLADADEQGRDQRARACGLVGEFAEPQNRRGLGDPLGPRWPIWESFAGHDGEERTTALGAGWWPAEPALGRVVDGFPGRVDQLRALGNAIVPQIAELIGRAILSEISPAAVGDPQASGAGVSLTSAPAEAGRNRREQPAGADFSCGGGQC